MGKKSTIILNQILFEIKNNKIWPSLSSESESFTERELQIFLPKIGEVVAASNDQQIKKDFNEWKKNELKKLKIEASQKSQSGFNHSQASPFQRYN
jgi:hypothetical protein